MKITVGHLYPDMLNLYGDSGNIAALKHRMMSRGIEVDIKTYSIEDDIDFSCLDIVYIGGGGEREQDIVCNRLKSMGDKLISYAEDCGVILAVCSGFEILGKYIKNSDSVTEGVGLLDIYADYDKEKIIGNVVLESEILKTTVVGFENHSGRMNIGSHTPLGKVITGKGGDGKGFEGVVYKNVVATYLHGPLLPKNPALADFLIKAAIERKYADYTLQPLDDTVERAAHDYIIGRFVNK